MVWYLVFYAYVATGATSIDPGISPGYVAPTQRIEVEMPSQEVCEQVLRMNAGMAGDCWAKKVTK